MTEKMNQFRAKTQNAFEITQKLSFQQIRE